MIDWILPIKTISESNVKEHWTKSRKRHAAQQKAIWVRWMSDKPKITLPCCVYLSRIAPRKLDDDNLVSSFKHVRDKISSLLIPGKNAGMADNDPRIKWLYGQRKGDPKQYAINIKIIPDEIDNASCN